MTARLHPDDETVLKLDGVTVRIMPAPPARAAAVLDLLLDLLDSQAEAEAA